MSAGYPACAVIQVFSFRGDRSLAYRNKLERMMDDEALDPRKRPSRTDVLLYAGHAGVSMDQGATIYGFHPEPTGLTIRQLLSALKAGLAFPGIVHDDTQVFGQARTVLPVLRFDVQMPPNEYNRIQAVLAREIRLTQFSISRLGLQQRRFGRCV